MLTETTVNKLNEMKLTTMARAFKEQLITPNISELSFEDRFGLLVDQEWTSRKNNHLKKLIKRAKFAESDANVEDIEYHADRKLDAAQIARLATCEYINEHHNILLLGATGCGKTYIACALGMAAVRNFLTVRYVRFPELLTELAIARGNGTYRKVIQQYKIRTNGITLQLIKSFQNRSIVAMLSISRHIPDPIKTRNVGIIRKKTG